MQNTEEHNIDTSRILPIRSATYPNKGAIIICANASAATTKPYSSKDTLLSNCRINETSLERLDTHTHDVNIKKCSKSSS